MESIQDTITVEYWIPERRNLLRKQYEPFIFGATVLYVPLLFAVQRIMKNREPLKLKHLSFLWNIMLSFCSGLGALIFLFFDPTSLTKTTLVEKDAHPYVRACICIFCLTKAVEFGDTFLLVLKKKPLRFLHVYHHLTVTLYCWHAVKVSASFGHIFAFINLTIHFLMYLYFAIATLYPRHPLLIACSSYITICQTTQMFIGMCLSFSALFRGSKGSMVPSTLEQENAMFALFLYTSYAYLFVLFYIERYLKNTRPAMVFVLMTLHFGGLAGAVSAWHHPRRYRIFLEIIIGYTLTAVFVYLCCHSLPRVWPCRNFLSVLLQSEVMETREKTCISREAQSSNVKRCNTTRKCTVMMASEGSQDITLAEKKQYSKARLGEQKYLEDHRMTWTLEKDKGTQQEDMAVLLNELSNEQFYDVREKMEGFVHIDDTTWTSCKGLSLVQRRPVRQALVLFNAWVLAALDRYQEPFCKPSGTASYDFYGSVSRTAKTLQEPSGVHKYFRYSWFTLNRFDLFSIKNNTFFFFTVSLAIPAVYGFVAHGNILLGLLVHGCLRWVIELYTTGALVGS